MMTVEQFNAILRSDPEYQAADKLPFSKKAKARVARFQQLAAQHQFQVPDDHELKFGGPRGEIGKKIHPALAMLPGIAGFGLAAGLPLLAGGGAASAAGGGAAASGAGGATTTAATTAAGAGLKSALPSIVGAAGRAMGAFAGGRAEGRGAEAEYGLEWDREARARHQAELDALDMEIRQREFASKEYDRDVGRSMRGGLLQGLEDVNIDVPDGVEMGTISGGLRPSAIVGKDEIGRSMQANALPNLRNPNMPSGPLRGLPTLEPMSRPPEPGAADTALNIGSIAAASYPFLDALVRRPRTPTSTLPPIATNPAPINWGGVRI